MPTTAAKINFLFRSWLELGLGCIATIFLDTNLH
jgi:hypothetical protein